MGALVSDPPGADSTVWNLQAERSRSELEGDWARAAALSEAGIGPSSIAFVNAHGTGTHDTDLVEGTTLAEVFGPGLKMLSTKGMTGHTLGAAGGASVVVGSQLSTGRVNVIK